MTTKTNYEILLDMQQKGDLNSLIRRGIVSGKFISHLKCYQTFLKLSKQHGPTEAIYQMEAEGPYSAAQLWRIIRDMQSPDPIYRGG